MLPGGVVDNWVTYRDDPSLSIFIREGVVMVNVLRIHPKDNVGVAVRDLSPGTQLELADQQSMGLSVTCRESIPFGHKVAITDIPKGQSVIKYGASIGMATRDITPGEHVHVQNLISVRGAATS